MARKKEIDVVLSGSGVKMMAFAGALKAIEEANCKIKRLAGTSGGAVVGSMYAAGMSPDEIKDAIDGWNYKRMVFMSINPFAWVRWGIMSSRGIQSFLEKHYGKLTFKDELRCELVCTGANVSMGRTDYFRPGEEHDNMRIGFAARISSAVPLAMGYVKYKKHAQVDGGLYDNYPVDLFDDHKRPTIGVRVNGQRVQPRESNKWNPLSYIRALLESASENSEREHIDKANWARTVMLRADQITGALNYKLTKEEKQALFDMGYEMTKKQLLKILKK